MLHRFSPCHHIFQLPTYLLSSSYVLAQSSNSSVNLSICPHTYIFKYICLYYFIYNLISFFSDKFSYTIFVFFDPDSVRTKYKCFFNIVSWTTFLLYVCWFLFFFTLFFFFSFSALTHNTCWSTSRLVI